VDGIVKNKKRCDECHEKDKENQNARYKKWYYSHKT